MEEATCDPGTEGEYMDSTCGNRHKNKHYKAMGSAHEVRQRWELMRICGEWQVGWDGWGKVGEGQ